MSPKAEKALRASVEKYRKALVTLTKARYRKQRWRALQQVSFRSEACPLCDAFFSPDKPTYVACEGCPVFECTRQPLCRGTPYQGGEDGEGLEELRDDLETLLEGGDHSPKTRRLYASLKKAVRREKEFLESLLPENS